MTRWCVDHPNDALPVSLEAVLTTHQVRYLKVKTAGDAGVDRDRLESIFTLCAASSITPRLTIDGNDVDARRPRPPLMD